MRWRGRSRIAFGMLAFFMLQTHDLAAPRKVVADVSRDEVPELRQRFIAAVSSAMRPKDIRHAAAALEVLQGMNQEFGLSLPIGEIQDRLRFDQPGSKAAFDPESAEGISGHEPIERSQDVLVMEPRMALKAAALAGVCRPEEADYNERYVTFLEGLQWPSQWNDYVAVRYAIYLRMYKRQCLSESVFQESTESLAAGLIEMLRTPGVTAGDAGSYIYLLAASDRMELVDTATLRRFVRAQDPDGHWDGGQVGEPAVSAAHGAYILAILLHRAGVPFPEDMIPELVNPPSLPPSSSFHVRP